MSRTTIAFPDRTYTVSPDDPVPPEGRFRALVVGQALDDITLLPLPVPVSVNVAEPGFVVEVKDDNWFVVAGVLRWQLPKFASRSYTLHLTLSAEGYVPKALPVVIPQPAPGNLPDLVKLPGNITRLHAQ